MNDTEAMNVRIVTDNFGCYRTGDRAGAERLVAAGFVFTSPQDDHIDRAAYFERCFPTAGRFSPRELLRVLPLDDEVVVL